MDMRKLNGKKPVEKPTIVRGSTGEFVKDLFSLKILQRSHDKFCPLCRAKLAAKPIGESKLTIKLGEQYFRLPETRLLCNNPHCSYASEPLVPEEARVLIENSHSQQNAHYV